MAAGKSLVIVLSIDSNMPVMELFQLLHMFEADVQAAFSSDRGGGVVGMATVTVPVTLNWLWSVCDIATIIFSNSNQRKNLNTTIRIFLVTCQEDISKPTYGHQPRCPRKVRIGIPIVLGRPQRCFLKASCQRKEQLSCDSP